MWVDNFKSMATLDDVVWSRVIVPHDAINMNMELIGCGDASKDIACAACYVRFKKRDGTYSCRLVLAKTKIIPDGMTLPRAELLAATLNTHITHVARRALERFTSTSVHILDSEIALFWIATESKSLKPWTRNNVIEISRFTKPNQWLHIESAMNPADLGTRKGATISQIDETSQWNRGMPWMQQDLNSLVGSTLKDVDQVKLKNQQLAEAKKELVKPGSNLFVLLTEEVSQDDEIQAEMFTKSLSNVYHTTTTNKKLFEPMTDPKKVENSILHSVYRNKGVVNTIKQRLQFSRYLIDPNKYRFSKVVRLLAIAIKFINLLFSSRLQRNIQICPLEEELNNTDIRLNSLVNDVHERYEYKLSDLDIQRALNYFFRKGTRELQSHVHPKFYQNESFEKDGILYYSGRVSVSDISFECNMTDKMIDLSKRSFIVPIIDCNSPLAYAITNQVHWYDKTYRHSGVETTLRALRSVIHIIKPRDLVKLFRKNCKRCRFLIKRTVEVIMSPASKDQLCVAPAYYITQVDLCGPFKAYSVHNKRSTIKIYISVFVCCTTGTTSLKVMEGYDTHQFLLCVSRFGCDNGWPKKLIADEGSQLVCGFENVSLNLTSAKGVLEREAGVEFRTCPVGGHNFNGRAERKVRTVREVLEKSVHLARLSTMEWETTCSEIANTINNMPIAIGNETDDLENLDLITPNRLRIGFNNNRSPVGPLEVTDKLERLMRLKVEVFEAWWEAWLVSAVPKLVPKPKWFSNDTNLKKGDVVIFNKDENSYSGEYKFGIIDDVRTSEDGNIRSVTVKYRNAQEEIMRTTHRAVRSLVIIHRVDEIDIMEELGRAAAVANGHYCMEFSSSPPAV